MKKLVVFLLFTFYILHSTFYITPAFAQTSCRDDYGGRCVPESIGCGAGEHDAGQPLGCPSKYTCCLPAGVPTPPLPPSGPGECPEGTTWVAVFRKCVNLGGFINMILQWAIILAAAAAAVMFVVGGIQYISSTGDPKSLENAHATMTSAIFGLVIVVIAWLVMKVLAGAVPPEWEIWFGISP